MTSLDRYNIQEAQKTLKLYDSVLDISKSTTIYLFKPDLFFNSGTVYPAKYLYILSKERYGLDMEELLNLVSDHYNEYIARLPDISESGMDKLVYMQTLPVNSTGIPNATVLVELDEEVISSYFNSKSGDEECTIAIINNQNHIIYSTNEKTELDWVDYQKLQNMDSYNVSIDNEDFITIITSSEKQNWLYIKLLSKSIFKRETIALRNRLLLLIATVLILGIISAYIIAKRNYLPLNTLARDIFHNSKDTLTKNNINEFELIRSQFDYEKEKQLILRKQIEKQNTLLKKNYLRNLIKGKISGLDEADSRTQGYDPDFVYDSYAVIVIKINDFSSIYSPESVEKDYELSTFIIKNVFEEISQEVFDSYYTEDDGLIAYIINFKKDELCSYSEYSNVLENVLVEIHHNVKGKIGIDFTSIVSNSHDTLMGISDAYRECLDALAYTKILGNTKIIFYQETLQSKAVYTYSIEKEHKIINLIKAADIGNARLFINDIIVDHRQNKQLSPASVQFLYYDILGTIMKTLTKSKEQELVEKLQPLKSLLECEQFDRMDSILNEFLSIVCEVKKEDKDVSYHDLLDKGMEFINKNLYNPDLNVAMVGDAFNITPAYLSKMIKNDTGESILQIINRLRVEKSKQLFKDNALSLNEISEKVGYLYPNTFIHIFRKFEGLTPGQYRKMV